MHSLRATLPRICETVILILSVLPLLLIASLCFIQQTYMPMKTTEKMLYYYNEPIFYIALGLVILLFLFTLRMIHVRHIHISEQKLFILFFLLYLIAGCYLVFNVHSQLRADAKTVFQAALKFRQGNYNAFTSGHYLYKYPHQLGLLTFERFLMVFSTSRRFFFFVYLMMVLAINFLLWKITALLFGNHVTNCFVILFSFLFLPQLFFILFLYGSVPGMLCLCCSVYCLVRFQQGKQKYFWLLGLLFLVLACLIRNNYMIAAIALFLISGVQALYDRSIRQIIMAALLVISIPLSNAALLNHYRNVTGVTANAAPKILWVTMGLQNDSHSQREGGWYNGYNDTLIRKYQYDMQKVKAQSAKDLKKQLYYLSSNPRKAQRFFLKKIQSTWCDPLYQSLWSGPIEKNKRHNHTALLRNLYRGKGSYQLLSFSGSVCLVPFYLLIAAYPIFMLRRKKDIQVSMYLFPCLFFLGGFLFHLVWETKSQYVYPYVLWLIPAAAYSASRISQTYLNWLEKCRNKQVSSVVSR